MGEDDQTPVDGLHDVSREDQEEVEEAPLDIAAEAERRRGQFSVVSGGSGEPVSSAGDRLHAAAERLLDAVETFTKHASPADRGNIELTKLEKAFVSLAQMAYTRNPNLEWYIFGDSEIKSGPQSRALRSQSAILFDSFSYLEALLGLNGLEKAELPQAAKNDPVVGQTLKASLEDAKEILEAVAPLYETNADGLITDIRRLTLLNIGIPAAGTRSQDLAEQHFDTMLSRILRNAWDEWYSKLEPNSERPDAPQGV